MTFDETHAYAPPAQRFMSLGRVPAEVDNYERRDSNAGIPYLPAVILGTMGRVLGNLERAFIAADVLFPALAFGLLYAASEGLLQDTASRLLLAWSTLLIPWGPRTFLWRSYDSLLAAPDFTRTPQPEISFTLVLLGVLLSSRALVSKKPSATISAGVIGALIVYSYYFYAIAWVLTLGLLLVLGLLWRNWAVAKRLTVMLSIIVFGSLPFIVAVAHGRSQGGQSYLLARVGTYTRTPHLIPLLFFVLGFLLTWRMGNPFFGNQGRHVRVGIFVCLFLSALAGMNIQMLTGYDAQHAHFWNRLILPVGVLLCGCWLLAAAERRWNRSHLLKASLIGILISLLLNAGTRQVVVGTENAKLQRASRPEIQLLQWVRSNLPAESVIGTVDPDLILLVPALTANFTYVPTGLRSLTPTEEIVDRYYELASFLDLTPAEVQAVAVTPSHHSVHSQLFLVLWGFIDPVAIPLSHESTKSGYQWVLKYLDNPGAFAEGYYRYTQMHLDREHRLDYVVYSAGKSMPPAIQGYYAHAKTVYVNQQYQLIALR